MRKKAQGLSITTIIVAVIALVVLVVLVAIFTGRIGIFSKGISEVSTCEGLGGGCQIRTCDNNQERIFGASDCGKDLSNDGGVDYSQADYCCK